MYNYMNVGVKKLLSNTLTTSEKSFSILYNVYIVKLDVYICAVYVAW